MRYCFRPEDLKERAREGLNSEEEVLKRGGAYVIPFVSSLPPENRVKERYGHLLQEKNRLQHLIWIEKDLKKCILAWKSFSTNNCMGSARSKGRYTDKNGKPSLEILWKGFLDYSGKNRAYRMRIKKSNRDVLKNQLNISVDWQKEGGKIFPIKKIKEKSVSMGSAIENTRKDILQTEVRLNTALVLLKEEYFSEEGTPTDKYKGSQLYHTKAQDIKNEVRDQLNGKIKNPQK